jgi:homoserine O-succinyltransferase/O-acetyltransferase
MPLVIEGRVPGKVPSHWLERGNSQVAVSLDHGRKLPDGLRLALINNMPDPALEDTELQFFELLEAASGTTPVYLRLYSLTGVPRTDRGQRYLNSFYFEFDDLWKTPLDGLIVTGTEPHHSDLRNEPYWDLLAEVFDWAARNTTSAILSCLAAHASVLYFDGIPRHRLADKQFGVFEATKTCEHPLMKGIQSALQLPHSRWNEVRANELSAAVYNVLTSSPLAGVDVFVKKIRQSLFLHFQGHPEYSSGTLFKEYRRDIRRFLRSERETYPTMPHGYFDRPSAEILEIFQRQAVADRREEVMQSFPESVAERLQNKWHVSAVMIYRNWLQYLASEEARRSATFPAMTAAYSDAREKRSAV